MRSVGINVLNSRLSEYVRLAASGETVLVTERDRVVAELFPVRATRSPILADALLADAARSGPEVTAMKMAGREAVDPKRFRRALRGENFPWHRPNARWTVGRDSPEHRDVLRVLGRPVDST